MERLKYHVSREGQRQGIMNRIFWEIKWRYEDMKCPGYFSVRLPGLLIGRIKLENLVP